MKILNIDALTAKSKRGITVDGQEHAIAEMDVEMFVESVKEADLISKSEPGSIAQLESTVRLVQRAVPTLPIERIRKLPMEVLGALVQFINGELDEEIRQGDAEGTDAGN